MGDWALRAVWAAVPVLLSISCSMTGPRAASEASLRSNKSNLANAAADEQLGTLAAIQKYALATCLRAGARNGETSSASRAESLYLESSETDFRVHENVKACAESYMLGMSEVRRSELRIVHCLDFIESGDFKRSRQRARGKSIRCQQASASSAENHAGAPPLLR